MSTGILPSSAVATVPFPQVKRWTVEEFHRICGEPVYRNNQFVLIDGEIIEMPVPNPPHDTGISLTLEALRRALPAGYYVRPQMPLILSLSTDPMPDLAVVSGTPRDYSKDHPTTAVLVIEVSDSTIKYDLGAKANIYAAARVAEYWVLDLVRRQLHVMRDPVADSSKPFGAEYRNKVVLDEAAEAAPLVASNMKIKVANMLP